jgi:hypothetical protein
MENQKQADVAPVDRLVMPPCQCAACQLIGVDRPIPNGVYWNAESANFYSRDSRAGMGMAFYLTWKPRSSEFPQCDQFGNPSA